VGLHISTLFLDRCHTPSPFSNTPKLKFTPTFNTFNPDSRKSGLQPHGSKFQA
jgi:hypothetical protein